jgi:dienelactone hydrolase
MMDTMPMLLKVGTVSDWLWKPYYLWRGARSFGPFSFTTRVAVTWPKVKGFFESLRADPETSGLPIGVAGFCWGGLYSLRLAGVESGDNFEDKKRRPSRDLVDAAFAAHPQPLSLPADIDSIIRPAAIAIGDRDWATRMSTIETIKRGFSARTEAGVECELVLYEGAGHGFAIRYDPENEKLAEQAEVAENQAVKWFKKGFAAVEGQ